jgi:2-polyprenyl-6-methoxyphenol hydroxylase-like FAD-dependent oxidoreductase
VRRLTNVFQVETDRTTHRARAVVGADGATSVVRRAVARLVYRIHSRWLLRFLWWNFGSLVGWLAEHRLVDWGE